MNQLSVIRPYLASKRWDDNTLVIQGRRIRDDLEDAPDPRFGEDRWDLVAMVFRNNVGRSECILDFTRFTDPARRMTAKELIMQKFNAPMVSVHQKGRAVGVATALGVTYSLGNLYKFMDRQGIPTLLNLTQDHINIYTREVIASGLSKDAQQDRLNIIRWLHEARDYLTYDHVAVLPWGGRSVMSIVGKAARGENKTPRIQEETMGPLLRWALLYVERFSDDIIAAWRDLKQAENDVAGRTECREGQGRQRVEAWIEDCRREGRRLPGRPGHAGRPNISRIARQSGLSTESIRRNYIGLVEAAVVELGLDRGSLGSVVSALPEIGHPWRPDFIQQSDVRAECRSLIAACYVVCAYLSGMRDSEVQAIRRGAYRPVRDETGEIVRHKLESTAFKGENADEGTLRTWVVIKPVAVAIDVLQRLTESIHRETGTDFLFVQMWGDEANPSLKSTVNYHLNRFVAWINERIQPRLAALGIPPIPAGTPEDPARITTRMFRRTVAWHIANRPFGTVAGMLQYGHAAEVTFEGYSGTSESGFRAEVEAERQTARGADLLEMYEDHKHGVKPAGPMAAELVSEFESIRQELGDFPGKVVDERRREKMLEHLRVRLHPGLMADCFFEPKDAACLRHLDEKDRKEPVAGICDPNCRNACWLKKHLAVWEGALTDVQRLSARNRISPIQRQILRGRATHYKDVIQSIKEANHGGE